MTEIRKKLYGNTDPYANTPDLPFDDHGWGSDASIFANLINPLAPKVIIEVGTWKGASARHMAAICKHNNYGTDIICVDTWLGSHEHWNKTEFDYKTDNLYNIFRSNTKQKGYQEIITPVRLDSVNAAHVIHENGIEADFIYIDAGHAYESVKTDLYIWWQLLKAGGMLLMDDAHYEPVKKAAKETFEDKIQESDGKFFIKKE